MGLIMHGSALDPDDARLYIDHVYEHGITQFLHIWNRMKTRHSDEFLWGDEIEYMILSYDDTERRANLSLRQIEVLEALPKVFEDIRTRSPDKAALLPSFHEEFGRYMIEGIPAFPLTDSVSDLLSVESKMRYRRDVVQRVLKPNERLFTLTAFPRLGAPGVFTDPHYEPTGDYSYFLPVEILGPKIQYLAMNDLLVRRRPGKVVINVPIFFDTNTPRPFVDPTIPQGVRESLKNVLKDDHILLDAHAFGGGCCCLQVTSQASDASQGRRLYDAFAPIAPIMLALTAASPVWKGYLTDVDSRWGILTDCSDERTEEERGLKPLSKSKYRIPKSRWAGISSYISDTPDNKREYSDTTMPYNEQVYNRLLSNGVDELLAVHIARMYIREPITIMTDMLHQDDENSAAHFESIHATNWQSVRFKIPPPGSSIGWRVEFRSMEVQLTDFENAAFSVFMILLSRAITALDTNFYIPISKVDLNMVRAQRRSAVTEEKFWFRKSVLSTNAPSSSQDRAPEQEHEEMSVDEIINGKGKTFPGLLGLVYVYLGTLDIEPVEMDKLKVYLDLVKGRANGSLMTVATWMRNFIRSHPAYAHDSVVNEEINYDLIKALDQIERGILRAEDLLPAGYPAATADCRS
ncbi:hypothetical protein BOTBODRAFT_167511 [Botryobasidium botryosum FD-172 SS1]|uniref:Glutamate--cysteine ligase n=1 Tax=Botryobasidium botryosum (strain FD-172 SS1) TaxID=930990 RepID=A0A067LX99_BOTB1|nr:hypothetical protein BOTBODRAFT_167511 [Botryobasidium botryosum FD-172 SS1]